MWEQRREEMQRLAGTMTAEQMAEHYGVTRGCLTYYASKFNISLRIEKLPEHLRARGMEE